MGIGQMNATINNNRKLLKNGKRKPFTKMNGGSSKKTSYRPYFPSIAPHKLRRVRLKVKKQNRILLIKKLIITTVILLGIIYWIYQL